MTLSVDFDDGDKATLPLDDKCAFAFDHVPAFLVTGQAVIAAWPDRKMYYPGYVDSLCGDGQYHVKYNDGDERCNPIDWIRAFPC